MRWYFLFAVTLGLSITDAVSVAQGQRHGEAERLAAGRSSSGSLEYRDAGYFATTGVVRFRMIQGRLQLDAPRHRKGSQSRDQDGVYECITVTAKRGIPSVHYVCQTKEQHVTLSVANATELRIESFLPQTGERAVLSQPGQDAIAWTIRRGDLEDTVHGATLLHVHHADPAGMELHCGGLIPRLLQGQSLQQITASTTDALLHQLSTGNVVNVDRDEVLDSVEKLRSSRRSVRVAASQRLLRWGTPIVAILRDISADELAPEQQDRLQGVLRRLKRMEPDTPRSLAMMLSHDQPHWQSIAQSLSGDQIAMANQHLTRAGLTGLSVADQSIEQIAQGQRVVAR